MLLQKLLCNRRINIVTRRIRYKRVALRKLILRNCLRCTVKNIYIYIYIYIRAMCARAKRSISNDFSARSLNKKKKKIYIYIEKKEHSTK